MPRPARLAFVCLALALLAWPLTLNKPGLPVFLKADEPAYLMMAQSIGHDFDLVLGPEDTERVFAEFPYLPVNNLILMTTDGWRTVAYGKPYLYSLFGAPFVRAFGANGLLFFNLLLLVGMMELGRRYLARSNPDGLATLFSVAFFGLSIATVYAFWLQPEIFDMFAVAAALYLAFVPAGPGARLGPVARAVLSGAVLALGVYHKPVLLAIALPILLGDVRARRWRPAAAWVAGLTVALGLTIGGSIALTGSPTSYLGVKRQGVTLCEPGVVPIGPTGGAVSDELRPTGGAWSWIFRVPDVDGPLLADNLGFFLWGRHTGLLLYMPFAALAVLLFLLHDRHDRRRWLLLAGLASVALFFVVFIPYNWQGGGGFVGNRYFVNVYPGFLFLVTRIAPRALVGVGCAVGGLFLGPVVLSPLGLDEPDSTLQAHVRRAPYRFFPIERSLREVPGYSDTRAGGTRVTGRKDQVRLAGDLVWVRGSDRVSIDLETREPVERFTFQVRNFAPGNRVELELGGDRQVLEFGEPPKDGPEIRTVELPAGDPDRTVRRRGSTTELYVLDVTTTRGRPQIWTKRFPPPRCPQLAFNETREETWYVGAQLLPLGAGADLGADVYGAVWRDLEVRRRVVAGQTFLVRGQIENRSEAPWVRAGAAEVNVGYRWEAADGTDLGTSPVRGELELPVGPGESSRLEMEVVAPSEPGDYVLVLDPVWEHVAWFSDRDQESVARVPITVVALEAGGGEAP